MRVSNLVESSGIHVIFNVYLSLRILNNLDYLPSFSFEKYSSSGVVGFPYLAIELEFKG